MNSTRVSVGAAYLLSAQGVFLLSSYAMHIVLGRYLGPAEYGLFGVVLYAATMTRTFVASGLPLALARQVSAKPEQAEEIFRAAFLLQFVLALIISSAFFLAAAPLAHLLSDPALIPLFRLAAPITLFFGIFALILQYYNGLRKYRLQSTLLAISYILRAGLVILFAIVGYRVLGAIGGMALAMGITSLLALITRRSGSASDPYPKTTLIFFAAPLILASIVQAFLIDLDLMFVKKLVAGESAAGFYTSAKALAQVTPFAFFALSSALYPAISSAYSAGNTAKLKRYIEQANRVILITVLPLILFISWDSEKIITLVYGQRYFPAAAALRWLIFSFAFLSVFIVHKTIITGCGFPKVSSALTLVLLPLCVFLHLNLIPIFGLVGAAVAATLTFFLGALGSYTFIYLKFKAGFYYPSLLRIIAAVLIIFTLDIILSSTGLPFLPKIALLGSLYLLLIKVSGELPRGGPRELWNQLMGQNDNRTGG